MYKIWLKRYLFRKTLVKLFFQLQNCRQQRRQKSLDLNHYPNRAMTAVSSNNKAAETCSKKAGKHANLFRGLKHFDIENE